MPSDLNVAVVISAQDLASSHLNNVDASLKKLGLSFNEVKDVAAGFLLGGAMTQFAANFAQKLEETVTETTRFGEATFALRSVIGGTAETSSQLLAVFQRMGVSVDDASRNLGIFSKHLAGIETGTDALVVGTKTFNERMKELGVTFTDASGKALPMNDVLLNVADKFAAMPDGVEKTALALALFGRAGRDMIPILDLGRAGIEEAEAAAAKYGLTLTGANVQAIRDYSFAHKDLDEAMQGLNISIGTMLMPALVQAAHGAALAAQAFNQEMGPAIRATITDITSMAQSLGTLGTTFNNVVAFVSPLTNALGGQAAVTASLAHGWEVVRNDLDLAFNPMRQIAVISGEAARELGVQAPATQLAADKMDILRMSSESTSGGVGNLNVRTAELAVTDQHLGDTMGAITGNANQLTQSFITQHSAEMDLIAATKALIAVHDLEAARDPNQFRPLAGTDPSSRAREAAQSQKLLQSNLADAEAAADKLKKAGGGIGSSFHASSLVAIAGLAGIDLAIAGTSQKLAGVQLQIEQKVLARMEARGAPRNLFQQEALLQEQLKVEQLQKASGFTVSQEQLKISNAQSSAAHHTVHVGGVTVNHVAGATPATTATAAAKSVHAAVISALNQGAGTSPGKAKTQLAGAR